MRGFKSTVRAGIVAGFVLPAMITASASAVQRDVPGQYDDIQAAIDACNNGDVVMVGDGTWSGVGNRDLDAHHGLGTGHEQQVSGPALEHRQQNPLQRAARFQSALQQPYPDRSGPRWGTGQILLPSPPGGRLRHNTLPVGAALRRALLALFLTALVASRSSSAVEILAFDWRSGWWLAPHMSLERTADIGGVNAARPSVEDTKSDPTARVDDGRLPKH